MIVWALDYFAKNLELVIAYLLDVSVCIGVDPSLI